MEELYKKDRHDPDNHYGVITHLEPDILEFQLRKKQREREKVMSPLTQRDET